MTVLHKLCKLLSLCQTVHLLNNNYKRDLGIWVCRIWNTCQRPLSMVAKSRQGDRGRGGSMGDCCRTSWNTQRTMIFIFFIFLYLIFLSYANSSAAQRPDVLITLSPRPLATVILLTSSVGLAPMKSPAWACKLTIHYFIVMFSGLYHCWTFTRIPCKLEILRPDNSVNKAVKYSHRGTTEFSWIL